MPKYKVPKSIQDVAARAVAQNLSRPISKRAAYKDEDGKRVAGTGMRTARRLISGAIDEQQLILMRAWFARHGASEKEKEQRKRQNLQSINCMEVMGRFWCCSFCQSYVTRYRKETKREELIFKQVNLLWCFVYVCTEQLILLLMFNQSVICSIEICFVDLVCCQVKTFVMTSYSNGT